MAQHVDFSGVQFEQTHAVLFAHLPPCDIRRTRVEAQLAVWIQRAHFIDVIREDRRQVVAAP
jgi:hypothetical protein